MCNISVSKAVERLTYIIACRKSFKQKIHSCRPAVARYQKVPKYTFSIRAEFNAQSIELHALLFIDFDINVEDKEEKGKGV